MIVTSKVKKAISAGALLLFTAFAVSNVQKQLDQLRAYLSRGNTVRRGLSLNLGGGDCIWEPPASTVSPDIDFHKLLIAGFPSGDKRMTFVQMEALTGLPSKDDWDFVFNGYTNAPFIKTNYPHPAGTWGWGTEADEVVLVVQFIRRSMVEFGDILWYQSKARTYNEGREDVEEQYGERMQDNTFYKWRDLKILQEIYRYGAYIDYWMEDGLRRDPFTHEIIDKEYWDLYVNPVRTPTWADKVNICHKTASKTNPTLDMEVNKQKLQLHIDHGDYYGICSDAVKEPSFLDQKSPKFAETHDFHCQNIKGGCTPTIVISSDKLRDYKDGPEETKLIGNLLKDRFPEYTIDSEAWPCIWDKIIDKNEGPKTFDDRKITEDPNFSAFMLEEMIFELNRMVSKYSSTEWQSNTNAQRLVGIFTEHLPLLKTELDEVVAGIRTLTVRDFLGPNERK
ncbi:hypothetical protein ACHAW6_011678 [Cyclotella cf. meneghiniana]